MTKSLMEIESYDRKVIVAGDYEEIRLVKPGTDSKGSVLENVASSAGTAAAAGAAAGLILGPVGATVGGIAGGLLFSRKNKNNNGVQKGVEYLQVPIAVAHREMKLTSPDHLRKGGIYCQSPRNSQLYYPAEKFHGLAFEDKYTEALRVLMSLRPRHLVVEHETGYDAGLVAGCELNAVKKMKMKLKGGYTKTDHKKIVFQASFEKPGLLDRFKKMELPDDLSWYPHEGKWRGIVEGVRNGMKEVDLELTYFEDFGFDVTFAGSLKRMGLNLNADFQQFKKTLWRIRGEFW